MPVFLLLKRDFWGLFGAIWTLAGVGFLVIGAGLALGDRFYPPLALGLIITVVGAVMLRRTLQRIRMEQYLRRAGLALDAEVIAIDPTGMRYNRRLQWKIVYQYVDGAGVRHRGSSGYLDPDEAAAWRVGDTGQVRVDPGHPARSTWVGRAGEL